MPKRGQSWVRIQWQEPNSRAEATTRMPVRSWHISAACTAAMPLAVAAQSSEPSSSAIRSSSIRTVGLPTRE